MDTTRILITIGIILVVGILMWFVLTKTSLGNSFDSKSDDDTTPDENGKKSVGSKSFASGK